MSLILLARDHVVHGWVLASGSFMLCAAFNVLLRGLCGRDTAPAAGPELVSARSVEAVQRLVAAARRDPVVIRLLAEPGERLDKLAVEAPEFHSAVLAELTLIGHRGPAEVEMAATSYADNPELLVRMVAKTLRAVPAPQPPTPVIPLRAKPVALLAARQLRDREVRRDRMVRAIWVLRALLREYGRRLTEAGVFDTPDDVFYLLVDEIDALPADVSGWWLGAVPNSAGLPASFRPRCSAEAGNRRLRRRRRWQPGTLYAESASAADGCAAGCGSCVRRPSTICSPARFWSPRSPTSDTPRPSATPPPW